MLINLSDCVWDKKSGVLVHQRVWAGYPMEVAVLSEKTGKVVNFVKDLERAKEMESWDGEMCEYIPAPNQIVTAVKVLVLR
jgi:hypothetical protein